MKRSIYNWGKAVSLPFFLLILLLSFPSLIMAGEGSFRFSGYLKHYFLVNYPAEYLIINPADIQGIPEPEAEGIVRDRCRLKISWQPRQAVLGEIAYDLVPQVSQNTETFFSAFSPKPDAHAYRAIDFHEDIYLGDKLGNSNFSLGQNLDRLLITLSPALADLHLGRQPIAFGSAHVFNPTDILAPFAFYALDKEERVGVDALRVKIPIGDMGEFDVGTVFGDDFKWPESAFFLRTRYYFRETDFTLMALGFKENLLGGFDLTRSIGGAGFWLETAYVFADLFDSHAADEDYFCLSTGLDYHFSEGIYLYFEYHFNGAGENKPENYMALFDDIAYQEGNVYLFGRHYLVPGIRYEITPLFIVNEQVLVNVGDGSLSLFTQLEYSFSEDLFVQAGMYVALGEEGELDLTNGLGGMEARPKSEFGLYPDFGFIALRLYF